MVEELLSMNHQLRHHLRIENDVREFFGFIKKQGRYVLTEPEAKKILTYAGIPSTSEIIANDVNDAQEAANRIGYPVVMKVVSPEIVHKSDSGGVRIGLQTPLSVKEAYSEIMEETKRGHPLAHIFGILIQEMLTSGIETILGVSTDNQFGQVIMFGLGGVFVEVLKDVAFRIVPLDKRNALEMLEEIKGKRLLEGYRHVSPTDKKNLTEVIVNLSNFAFSFKDEIQEIDINPLHCRGTEIKAMDAVITLRR